MNINLLRNQLKSNVLAKIYELHENEYKQVLELLQTTIKNGESNSALLIGPQGSGKTTLVNRVIEDIKDNNDLSENCLIVQLQGLVHTDDRLALKSITNQMNLDNAVDGKVFGSFAENLSFLLACLRTGHKQSSKSIIFTLDQFDLFCAHSNQTLLYNLFDVSQSAQAPICVLGITSRFDVIELLEKRVKSRFSHRQIFLFCGGDQEDLEYTTNRIKEYLQLSGGGFAKKHVTEWSKTVESLLEDKKVVGLVQRIVDLDKNERTIKNILFRILCQINEEQPKITSSHLQKELNFLERDETVLVLQDLTVLELSLIISMKHHCDIYDNQAMNFEMILARYLKFANANSNIQTVQRPVIMKAFEHIQSLELVSMMNLGGSRVQREYKFFKLLVTPAQISEAISKIPDLPTEVVQWANSSFV